MFPSLLTKVFYHTKSELETLRELPITIGIKMPTYILVEISPTHCGQTKWGCTVIVKPLFLCIIFGPSDDKCLCVSVCVHVFVCLCVSVCVTRMHNGTIAQSVIKFSLSIR